MTQRKVFKPTKQERTEEVIDVYEKIIDIDPSPFAESAGLTGSSSVLAMVFGYRRQGECTPLPNPMKVLLPLPTGPADACGYDASKYVVWKRIPTDLVTAFVQGRSPLKFSNP